MRISKEERSVLKNSMIKLSPNAKIYLFGSRVDDNKKGGDIDILILSNKKLNWKEKGQITYDFYNKFGEQKLDLVSFTFEDQHPFKKLALLEAIELWKALNYWGNS